MGYGNTEFSCIIAARSLAENDDNSVDKTYSPHAIEQRWYETWEKRNYFAPSGGEQAYCIMIPPPNVTGSLHMGHAFQDTIMDALIRYHRMKGDNTLWQVGTDHAGIATQMVVERQLEAESRNRHDLGRDNFIERVWQWLRQLWYNDTRNQNATDLHTPGPHHGVRSFGRLPRDAQEHHAEA